MATPITVPPFFYSLCWFVIPTAPPCGGCWFMHSGPFRCSTWSKPCISICPITFTAIGFSAILTNVEIHSSAYGRKDGRPQPPARCGKEANVSPSREDFPWEVVHITSFVIEAIGVLGSVSSILAFAMYLYDKYDKKK